MKTIAPDVEIHYNGVAALKNAYPCNRSGPNQGFVAKGCAKKAAKKACKRVEMRVSGAVAQKNGQKAALSGR